MAEEGHERPQRDADLDQRSGVSVAELVGGDVPDPGRVDAVAQFFADRGLGESVSLLAGSTRCFNSHDQINTISAQLFIYTGVILSAFVR